MKQKVSEYIADRIVQWGIRDVFTVTGGGAMHMNDAFGHHSGLHCTYQHHEQACAMAAEWIIAWQRYVSLQDLGLPMPLPESWEDGWTRFL